MVLTLTLPPLLTMAVLLGIGLVLVLMLRQQLHYRFAIIDATMQPKADELDERDDEKRHIARMNAILYVVAFALWLLTVLIWTGGADQVGSFESLAFLCFLGASLVMTTTLVLSVMDSRQEYREVLE